MPPGRHVIEPLVSGQPVETEIVVDAELGSRVQAQFRRLLANADAGTGDKPFLDFNHSDSEASAHVLDMYWGGDDPMSGGIRAKIRWTEAGRASLAGRSYRRFSPSWFIDEKSGEFAGIAENLGGLVNRAAFRTIQPVVAKSAGQNPVQNMTPADNKPADPTQLAQLLKEALQPLVDQLAELKAMIDPEAAAKDPAKPDVSTEKAAARFAGHGSMVHQVKMAVAVHARRGVIPPQNQQMIQFWERAYMQDPDATEAVLASMQPNPVLGVQYTTATRPGVAHVATGTAQGFVALVSAKMAGGKKAKAEAVREAVKEDTAGYQAWRESGGQIGL